MRRSLLLLILLIGACAACAGGCSKAPAPPPVEQPKITIDPAELTAFAPLPDEVPAAGGAASADLVALGKLLYFEPRLSKSQKISCNSCHDLATYGVDNQPTSDGHKGQRGDRNSPTVFNAAGHFAQFWDGRAPDVEAQAKGPVLNPVEMAMPAEPVVVKVLESMPEYVDLFKRAFPNEHEASQLRQHGEGHRRLRAEADDAVALGQVPEGRQDGPDAGGEAGLQDVRRRRLQELPRGRAAGRERSTRSSAWSSRSRDRRTPGGRR